jgi:DhnA family fructose-bisphosphate aldolase class Ia
MDTLAQLSFRSDSYEGVTSGRGIYFRRPNPSGLCRTVEAIMLDKDNGSG